ncbi:MAG: sigma-54 dependent transcriptional regulator [Planctomycetes bacterium]|nr:sigma-54 dependent transcriptional regulator [Planctomycetota bacterium]MCC7399797.1 sigma-54-dependent Fis family transcriptional regulator [Planctomycetota bacterium]
MKPPLKETCDVLVVDDEKIVCASCARILGDEGHRVTTTQDPHEGLRLAAATSPDVAIVDLKMPGMDGIEFLRQVKQVSPATEVMIVTGFAEIQTAVQAMKLGAFDYVPKPFSPDQLLIAVSKMQQRRRLERENAQLREELHQRYRFENIVGRCPRMQQVYQLLERVAPTESTVLIRGASGTGKELVARAIHFNSARRSGRFLAVDCGALNETVLESELFGHAKGAFTGAVSAHKGVFEAANGGTLFLDEIGNIPLAVQVRLLRVLQEREFKPVGATEVVKADIRLIAATNRDLEDLVQRGEFREDLYYRINIVPIQLPPLRERKQDIPDLVMHFLKKHREGTGCSAVTVSGAAMDLLQEHDWPGNVRELENTMQRAMVLATGDQILPEHLPASLRHTPPALPSVLGPVATTWEQLKAQKHRLQEELVMEAERQFVLAALERWGNNATRAAEAVGMLRPNFQALMKRHHVRREEA